MIELKLPDVGEGLEEGEIVAWLVAVGDVVRRDQPVVEVQTDKATVELPAPVAGRVAKLAAVPGEIVKVGDVLIVFDDGAPGSGEATPAAHAAAGVEHDTTAMPARRGAVEAQPAPLLSRRPRATPAVRKLAADLGLDLTEVHGTGPDGRILTADVQAAASLPSRPAGGGAPDRPAAAWDTEAGADGPGPDRPGPAGHSGGADRSKVAPGRYPLRGIRRLTADAMTRSWSEIPHITVMDELDATRLLEARRHLSDAFNGAPVTVGLLLVAAVTRGLRRHPMLNSSLDTGEAAFTVHDRCHVGLAVATDRGLVVPVIRDADRRPLPELAAEVGRLTAAARTHQLQPAELAGGTFTVSNYGSVGGRFATPLIRPPEAGVMGFGAIRPRPIVIGGQVEARPTLPFACSADHRLVDGDELTAFCEHVARLLTEPVALLASFVAEA